MTCKIRGLNISKFFEHMNNENDEDNNEEDSEQDKEPFKFVASKEMEEYFKNKYGGENK